MYAALSMLNSLLADAKEPTHCSLGQAHALAQLRTGAPEGVLPVVLIGRDTLHLLSSFFSLRGLATTAGKGLFALHGGWLTPLAQPPVGYPQVACHLSQRFTAGLRKRHSFDFQLMCEAPLCFRHHALFLEAVILVYILRKRGLSPLRDSPEGSIEGFLG